uniref:Uncharacterized protein n=1 Tax=Amblyomma tuberculatum TaxID=48802 RepID=A0A6M2E2X8_9ACAR
MPTRTRVSMLALPVMRPMLGVRADSLSLLSFFRFPRRILTGQRNAMTAAKQQVRKRCARSRLTPASQFSCGSFPPENLTQPCHSRCGSATVRGHNTRSAALIGPYCTDGRTRLTASKQLFLSRHSRKFLA